MNPQVRVCGVPLPEPGHICAFFDSREEKYGTIAPYFVDGLGQGDRIINVVDAINLDGHLGALEAARVPVQEAREADRLRVLTSEDTYLRDGSMNMEGMLDLLWQALSQARLEGRRVRTCGEMNWIAASGTPIERVLEYEARVNYFLPTFTCTLMCVYDLAVTPARMVSDLLATHTYAIVKGRLQANPYHVHPDEYLQMLRART